MAETSTNEIRVGDAAWRQIEALLTAHDPAKRLGRKRAPQRMAADALAWRLATGLPWNRLPSRYGDDSTAHRTVQRGSAWACTSRSRCTSPRTSLQARRPHE